MKSLRRALLLSLAVVLASAVVAPAAMARTVGQFIDDTTITTEVKAKLTAEKVSNLTKIAVKTDQGIVTLNGTVDTPERAARAEQIASAVNGVRGIVNNLHVAGSTVEPSTVPGPAAGSSVSPEWRMGTVRAVDRAGYQMYLTDGTVVRLAPSAFIHRGPAPIALERIVPGSEVVIRTLPPGSAEGSAFPGRTMPAPTIDAVEINVVGTPR